MVGGVSMPPMEVRLHRSWSCQMGWALRKFVKMTRLAPLRIGKIKKGVDK